mmetsp:Transcript_123710/g.276379  ORF Transcript_123710/g.276379 Transcript_123710/m.276379 type:complete len:473 (+) Transcript_123710:50-1468(+)
MALLAITLSTCVFFIGSLATSCLDDEVAMFQGKVHLHRDDELTSFKQYLSDLESKPHFMQVQTLTKWAGYLPMLEAWDKTVVEFNANMTKGDEIGDAILAWVQTYRGNGTNVDQLHLAAEIIDVVSQLPLDQFGLSSLGQSAEAMSTMIGNFDKLVNGMDEMSDTMKWKQANSTLSWMNHTLDQWSAGNDQFLEEVKLMEEALKRILDKVILPLNVKMDILKVPFAALRVHQHTITALQFVKPRFEEAFNELDTTKDRMRVAETEAAMHTTKVGIEVVEEMMKPFQHHQELVQAAVAARNMVEETKANENTSLAAVEVAKVQVIIADLNAAKLLKQAADDEAAAHQAALEATAAAKKAEDLLNADSEQIEAHRKEMAEQNKTLLDQFSDIFEVMQSAPPTVENSTAAGPKVALKPPAAAESAKPEDSRMETAPPTVENATAAEPKVAAAESADPEDSQKARPKFGLLKFGRR